MPKSIESTTSLNKIASGKLKAFTKEVPRIALVTAGIAGLTAAARGIAAVHNKLANDPERKKILEDLVREDPVLRDADPEKLKEYYAVIYHIAPNLTLNKGALREPLKNFVRFDKVDLATMKSLAELEDKMKRGSTASANFLNDMGTVLRLEQGISSIGKTASAPKEEEKQNSSKRKGSMAKLAASYYTHNKIKDRYRKGIESINYFKEKGIF